MIIHAKDDPFMTDDAGPKNSFLNFDNIDYRLFQKAAMGFITEKYAQTKVK
ncbi:hypothetical protein O9992_07435 [Vibrio lentus]|nr:hypothetical protein [Vibrio lentus]